MKKDTKHFFADRDVQVILGSLLRIGVILSMMVILVGGLLYLINHKSELTSYSTFNPTKLDYASISSILIRFAHFDSRAIIQLGVLLLIFTPVARVVFSVFSFIIERDYLYVAIGLVVLAIIMFSLSNKLVH